MKKIMILLTLLVNTYMLKSQVAVGHRDNSNQPVLEISSQDLLPLVQSSFKNYQNVTIERLELSDNPAVEGYLPSLIITISFSEPNSLSSKLGISFQYMLKYDRINNRYGGSEQEPIAVGPKQCLFENCVGCRPVRDDKGKITNCTPCLPTSPNQNYYCKIGREDITVDVITALTGLITSITGLIGVL